MKIEVYDTYATASDGAILHFESIVRAGTCRDEVELLIHGFVGADGPEIEMELDSWKSSGHASIDQAALAEVERCGFAVVPLTTIDRAAG